MNIATLNGDDDHDAFLVDDDDDEILVDDGDDDEVQDGNCVVVVVLIEGWIRNINKEDKKE